jgi:MYXO-CTERM domain-containing protein
MAARVIGFVLVVTALVTSATASADIIVQPPLIDRTPEGGADIRTQSPTTQYYISRDDCASNRALSFSVDLGGASPSDFQVWASTDYDCTVVANRTLAVPGGGCALLPATVDATGHVVLSARDIVMAILGPEGCDAPPGGSTTNGGPGLTGPVAMSLYFMLLPNGQDPTQGNSFVWNMTSIDLWAPSPVTGVRVSGSVDELLISLPVGDDPNTEGYYVFCVPANGPASGSTCPGGVTLPAADLTITSPYVCGARVPVSTTLLRVTSVKGAPVQSDVTYFVAVASYDEVNNLAPLSSPFVCATPLPALALPNTQLGSADSRGCAIRGADTSTRPPWAALGIAALAAAFAGRRRPRAARCGTP